MLKKFHSEIFLNSKYLKDWKSQFWIFSFSKKHWILLIKLKQNLAPKVQVNLRVTTDSVVQRDHPLGSTVVPKVANVIDHGTHTSEVVPYNEMRSMQATSTVVWFFFEYSSF